jgi:hypothetical protein
MSVSGSNVRNLDEAHVLLIDLCKLALVLNKCLLTKFAASDAPRAISDVYSELIDCSDCFASRITQNSGTLTLAHGFYPAVLRLIHLDYLIVMQRMLSPSAPGTDAFEMTAKYAGLIGRILEDFLSSAPELITRLPFLTFPAIFCSILINIISIRRQAGNVAILAEHRANLAMVLLDQLQDRWPLVVWTRYLLHVLLKDTKRAPPAFAAEAIDERARSDQPRNGASNSQPNSHPQTPAGPGLAQQQQRPYARAGIDSQEAPRDQNRIAIIDSSRFNSEVEADLSFSPMPFLFPLNSLLEDAGMEYWDLEQGFGNFET